MSRSFSRTGLSIFFYLLLETFIFIGLTTLIGFWSTIAISIGTSLFGWLIRPRLWKTCLETLGQGRVPPIASCYAPGQWQRMSASFLLILPGILTDVIGILILIPPIWKLVVTAVGARFLRFLGRQTNTPMGRRHNFGNTRKAMGRGPNPDRQHANQQNDIDVDVIIVNIKTPTPEVKREQERPNTANTSANYDPDVIDVDYKWLE